MKLAIAACRSELKFVPFVLLALCIGCTASSPRYQVEKVPQSAPEVSIETREQQIRMALDRAPLRFEVDSRSDANSRQRILLFFQQYLSAQSVVEEWRGGTEYLEARSTNFAYRVTRTFTGSARTKYTVRCIPVTQAQGLRIKAHSNEKNLARFLRDGQLELSMLEL